MKSNCLLIVLLMALVGNAVCANEDSDQNAITSGDTLSSTVEKNETAAPIDNSANDADLISQMDSLNTEIQQLAIMAKEVSDLIPSTENLQTREEIQTARTRMQELENSVIRPKLDALDKKNSQVVEKISNLDSDVQVRISDIEEDPDSMDRVSRIKNKMHGINEEMNAVSESATYSRRRIWHSDEVYLAAENKIKLAEDQAEQAKRSAEIQEARRKQVLELRSQANLDEEEYIVPLFECNEKGAYWCFSSSHNIYAITAYVQMKDDSPVTAAIYKEIGQGEVQDYTKEKANALESIGLLQKIWVSGTGKLPRVFMDRDRR